MKGDNGKQYADEIDIYVKIKNKQNLVKKKKYHQSIIQEHTTRKLKIV